MLGAVLAVMALPAVSGAGPAGGLVVAWGDGAQGQTTVPSGSYRAIGAGFYHALAVRSNGTVAAWGGNSAGQSTVPPGLSGVTAVAAGYAHSLALKSDGTVVAWGDNFYGQSTVPAVLTPGGVSAIAAGANFSLALTTGGTVVAWGQNDKGQTFTGIDFPVTAIAAGADHGLAIDTRGGVWAWGDNGSGQTSVPPVLGPQGLGGVTAIAAGIGHSLAVRSGGTVVAWGNGASGQTSVPNGLSGVTAVAAGADYSLALKSNGTIVAWGGNSSGQTTVPPGLTNGSAIAAKYGFSLALHPDITSPLLQVPGPITVTAGGPAGAVVNYQFSANDVDDPVSASSCRPASGTTFPVGLTVVGCTATDTHGNSAGASFRVTVKPPPVVTTTTQATTTTTAPRSIRPTPITSTTRPPPTTTTTPTSVVAVVVPPPIDPPPPPPPATPSTPPPVPGPSVTALSADHHNWGPAGGDLQVSGTGYAGCQTVYFFFDKARVGSAPPDSHGNVSKGGLSVPGDAGTGRHRVSSSCDPAGRAVAQTAAFTVRSSSAHRTAFVTSLPNPGQVSLNPGVLAVSAAVALSIIPLLAFPSQLFNSTLQENYDEVSGWFARRTRRPGKPPKAKGKVAQAGQFVGFLAIGAVLYGLLTPGFGMNRTSLALAVGLALALFVICVGFSLPTLTYMRRHFGERGKLRILPGTIVIAIICVGLSRLLHLQPGALYGLLAVFAFGRDLDKKHKGRLSAVSAAFMLSAAVAAWFIRVPVASAAGRPGAGLGVLIVDAALSAIFLLGLESVVLSLLPLRFLDGSNLMAWNRVAWAALFGLGVFAVFHILLRPGSGYVGHTSGGSLLVVGACYAAFGLLSVGFWAYFRFRREPAFRDAPAGGMTVGLTE